MAQKIVRLGFPKARPEYTPSQLDQLMDTLEQLIQQLNTTISNEIPDNTSAQQASIYK